MPFEIAIDREAGVVITTAISPFGPDDLIAHAKRLVAIPDRPKCELVDLRGHSDPVFDMGSVRQLADFLRTADAEVPGGMLALVADMDSVYGTLRLFAAHREHDSLRINVFRELEGALRWLGVHAQSP